MRTSKDLASVLATQGLTSDVFRLFMRLKRSSSRVNPVSPVTSMPSSRSKRTSRRGQECVDLEALATFDLLSAGGSFGARYD